jgi:hypothetical protein
MGLSSTINTLISLPIDSEDMGIVTGLGGKCTVAASGRY